MSDGVQLSWLYRHSKVLDSKADDEGASTILRVRIRDDNFRKHAAKF